jgi:hypothetical protein
MTTNTSPVTRNLTVEVPNRALIAQVQGEMTRVLDEHAIVDAVGGSGQVLTFRVTFGNAVEVPSLVHSAYLAGLHVTPIHPVVVR